MVDWECRVAKNVPSRAPRVWNVEGGGLMGVGMVRAGMEMGEGGEELGEVGEGAEVGEDEDVVGWGVVEEVGDGDGGGGGGRGVE